MFTEGMIVRVDGNSHPELHGLTGKVAFIHDITSFGGNMLPCILVEFGSVNEEQTKASFFPEDLMPIGFVDFEFEQKEWISLAGPCILCSMPKGIKHEHVKR